MANTTSPASQQIPGPGSLTDDEIRSIYDWTFLSNLPCPDALFLAIIHLTRLRVQVHSGQITHPALHIQVHDLLQHISTVDLSVWSRAASAESDNAPDVAEAFRHATLLYGIVALPRHAVVSSWAGDGATYTQVRSAQQQVLLVVMRKLAPRVKCRCCITWPLVVAGVAAADGCVPALRDFVEESLLAMDQEPAEAGVAFPTLQRLRALWWEGRTAAWDDAFPSPCIVIQ